METRDIVVIGASAGGIEALVDLVKALPPTLPAAVFVVVHFPSYSNSLLPQILQRSGKLPATHPRDGEPIVAGNIYVAEPNTQLIVHQGFIEVGNGMRVNGFRPAIDSLFWSAADAYGPGVIGVILSGMLDDGVSGMQTIKKDGGITIVQDPNQALFSTLPENVLKAVEVDYILPVEKIGETIRALVGTTVELKRSGKMPEQDEANLVRHEIYDYVESSTETPIIRSTFTCPECGGVIYEVNEGDLVRFRCQIGHTFSTESMVAAQNDNLEAALWVAVRALQERSEMYSRLATLAEKKDNLISARSFRVKAKEMEDQSNLVRSIVRKDIEIGAENSEEQASVPESHPGLNNEDT